MHSARLVPLGRVCKLVKLTWYSGTLALTALLTLVILPGGQYALTRVGAGCQFSEHSLLAASASDIEQQAHDYACARLEGIGDVQTLLNRPATPTEAFSLFGESGGLCRDQKLALVILKGDFVPETGFIKVPPHFAYLVLVMDLKRGTPTIVAGRAHGEGLGKILNDPSLPDDASSPRPSEIDPEIISRLNLPAPLQPIGVLPECYPDNYVAPTAKPPTKIPHN